MAQMELRRSATARDEALRLVRAAGRDPHRQILDSAIDYAMVTMDLDARVTGWNAGAEAILGWSEAEMCGRPAHVFLHRRGRRRRRPRARDEGRARARSWHRRALAPAQGRHAHLRVGRMMPLRDEDGGLAFGYLKILRDRTSRHLAGTALAESEARLRKAQAAGGVGLFTVDMADNVLTPTRNSAGSTACPNGRATLRRPSRTWSSPRTRTSSRPRRAGGRVRRPRTWSYRIRRPDTGDLRWIARKGEIERDAAGRPVRFSGVARDVTEQRTALDALAVSEERYRTLFDSIDEGFCVIRFLDGPHGPLSDYVHVEANRAFAHHLGVSDAVGRTLRQIIPDAGADGWLGIYRDVLETGEPVASSASSRRTVASWRSPPTASSRPAAVRSRCCSPTSPHARRRRPRSAPARRWRARTCSVSNWRSRPARSSAPGIGTCPATGSRSTRRSPAPSASTRRSAGRAIPLARIVETVHPDDQAGLAEAIAEAIARGGAYLRPPVPGPSGDGNYYWLEANGRVDHAAMGRR